MGGGVPYILYCPCLTCTSIYTCEQGSAAVCRQQALEFFEASGAPRGSSPERAGEGFLWAAVSAGLLLLFMKRVPSIS